MAKLRMAHAWRMQVTWAKERHKEAYVRKILNVCKVVNQLRLKSILILPYIGDLPYLEGGFSIPLKNKDGSKIKGVL